MISSTHIHITSETTVRCETLPDGKPYIVIQQGDNTLHLWSVKNPRTTRDLHSAVVEFQERAHDYYAAD